MTVVNNLFLVKDRRYGQDHCVFTRGNPLQDNYKGNVTEGVELDYDMNAIHLWPTGESKPEPQLGRSRANSKHYKVFRSPQELADTKFDLVDNKAPILVNSWADYESMFPKPKELAQKLEEYEWFDFLDETDEGMKLRRQKDLDGDPPVGSDRDRIAEWVARQHLSADGSIRQVYYLPTNSPAQEIRLLEINERISTPEARPEPLDFGVEIAGQTLKVSVADISKDQLEIMRKDSSFLPRGWDLQGAKKWGIRA